MSAIDQLFQRLGAQQRTALIPFVTAGDPDLDFTALLVAELVRRGASLCELGIPYSDPIADGPVIQASYTRALEAGISLSGIFDTLGRLAPRIDAPLVTMVSYAIIYRDGLQRYVERAKAAGAAGAIVPDLPIDEAEQLAAVCRKADFSLIQLVAPTTPRERALRIADTSSGFLYYVSIAGITGERPQLPPELSDNVAWLREQTELPVCVGFGISQPDQVRMLAPVADGLIVGSAIMRRVAEVEQRGREEVIRDVGDFVSELLDALDAS